MNYPSMRIEGAILSPDIVERLEDAPGQKPVDFGFDSTIKVKDEIVRAWADAQDYWRIYQRKLESIKADSPATTETRQQWIVPFLSLLGYQLEYQSRGVELNGKLYAISHRVVNQGHTPVHVIGCNEPAGLDRKPERAVLRMSAHAMLQEYLNLQDELYGIVTNGRSLRLLRDSSRLVKLTYLEFDLDRIFTDGLFADFAVLFRLLHASRLPATPESSAESLIERYHQDSLDSGARIRDGLSYAVEHAIRNFANGFLSHPENNELRELVASDQLKPDKYYQQLLRLIYRLLFLMVIEERDLVYPKEASASRRSTYDKYYSLRRLRNLSEKRYLADRRRHDHWQSLLSTFQLFEADGPGDKLGIAPLAGDLFDPNAIGILNRCTLGNDTLLESLRLLSLYSHPDTGHLIRVNYGALNVEEFGSVYEGLLEYIPVFITVGARTEFSFERGDDTTGSHYTPDDFVQPLIKHSLDYLISDRLKEKNPERALLSLRVADISCGSGHILLAAARRIATQLASVRTGEEQPSPSAFRIAVRDVIRECIYGVDLNPLAVELCKVALWLEAHIPGLPLNFLDHHIKRGNAIVGYARREDVDYGVPDEAFAKQPDDDKDLGATFRKKNKDERKAKKQAKLNLSPAIKKQLDSIIPEWRELSALPEKTPEEVEEKKRRFHKFTHEKAPWLLGNIAGIPIAQFFLRKTHQTKSQIITDSEFQDYWSGRRHPQGQGIAAATAIAHDRCFFNWFLEFPDIIEQGGFDCLLGNPPYMKGRAISGTHGDSLFKWITYCFHPSGGLADLVVYFLRRCVQIKRSGGFIALIATNTISEGDSRKFGLSYLQENNYKLCYARKSVKWPGKHANLHVSLVSLTDSDTKTRYFIHDTEVKEISPYLTQDVEPDPVKLAANSNRAFAGSVLIGQFELEHMEGESLLADNINKDIVKPYLIGDDVNNRPDHSASRYVIDFKGRGLDESRKWPELISLIEQRVKPSRDKSKQKDYREKWWLFARNAKKLYDLLEQQRFCLVATKTTKHISFVRIEPNNIVLDQSLTVIVEGSWEIFAVLQSTFHDAWARRFGTTHETRARYNNTDCFEKYPFPLFDNKGVVNTIVHIGETYHEHRRKLLLNMNLGLTKAYNLFHTPDLTPGLISKAIKQDETSSTTALEGLRLLRNLHTDLDLSVLEAYGWHQPSKQGPAIDLQHDFYEVDYLPENDRIRYTISPGARKEVLCRLLALNHERAKAEGTETKAARKKSSKKSKKQDINQQELL